MAEWCGRLQGGVAYPERGGSFFDDSSCLLKGSGRLLANGLHLLILPGGGREGGSSSTDNICMGSSLPMDIPLHRTEEIVCE